MYSFCLSLRSNVHTGGQVRLFVVRRCVSDLLVVEDLQQDAGGGRVWALRPAQQQHQPCQRLELAPQHLLQTPNLLPLHQIQACHLV